MAGVWIALRAFLGPFLKRVFAWLLANLIGRALLAVGLSVVTYKFAVQPFFDQLHSMVTSNAGELALEWFGFLDVDKAITVIASAYVIRTSVSVAKVVKKS